MKFISFSISSAVALLICITHSATSQAQFSFTGAVDNDFFNELNWEDGGTLNPAAGSIDPSVDITIDLIIDGITVQAADDIDIGDGGMGSLTVQNGGVLNQVTGGSGDDFDIDGDGTVTIDGGILNVADNAFVGGAVSVINGGEFNTADAIQFQDTASFSNDSTGTFFVVDDFEFDENVTYDFGGATIESGDQLRLDGVDVVADLTNVVVNINNGDDDLETGVSGGIAGTLILRGNSQITVDDVDEGAALELFDSSVAEVQLGDSAIYVGSSSDGNGETITLQTLDTAQLIVPEFDFIAEGDPDPRNSIINGLTGLSYNDDNPLNWNVTDWDGISAQILFVVNNLPVPEPSSLVLAAVFACCSGVCRMRIVV